ncbi:MAG TPA: phosphatase PAP2 family protein [Patescibacteria group bacterium]|nr:phosphatase PAP2 family protein [Patescibacteria group bacterium]
MILESVGRMRKGFLTIILLFSFGSASGFAQFPDVQMPDSATVSYNICDSLPLDAALVRSVNIINNPGLTRATEIVSDMLYPVTLGAPVVFLAYGNILNDRKLTETSALILASEAATYGFVALVKHFTDRQRPYIAYPDCIITRAEDPFKSFPSGHAAGSACILTMVSLQYPKWYVVVPSIAFVAATNFSRMHLGLHYPSDVTVGTLIGSTFAYVIWRYQDVLLKPLEPILPTGEGGEVVRTIQLVNVGIPF